MAEGRYITGTVDYKYEDYWIPPRCRKPRSRMLDGSYEARVQVLDDAPLVGIIHEYQWVYEAEGEQPDFRMVDVPVYKVGGKFFEPSMAHDLVCKAIGETTVDMLMRHLAYRARYGNYDSQTWAEADIQDEADRWLVVGGKVYRQAEQAVYSIRRMGLGHNHGGTCYSIDRGYNPNIPAADYFNANDIEAMFDRFFAVALGRGDTDSARCAARDLATGYYEWVEVLVPEAFDANPSVEAGEGDPFMNRLHGLTDSASSPGEAAVLVLAATLGEMRAN